VSLGGNICHSHSVTRSVHRKGRITSYKCPFTTSGCVVKGRWASESISASTTSLYDVSADSVCSVVLGRISAVFPGAQNASNGEHKRLLNPKPHAVLSHTQNYRMRRCPACPNSRRGKCTWLQHLNTHAQKCHALKLHNHIGIHQTDKKLTLKHTHTHTHTHTQIPMFTLTHTHTHSHTHTYVTHTHTFAHKLSHTNTHTIHTHAHTHTHTHTQ